MRLCSFYSVARRSKVQIRAVHLLFRYIKHTRTINIFINRGYLFMKNITLLLVSILSVSLFSSSIFADEEERIYVKADLGSSTFPGFESSGSAVSSESKVGSLVAIGVGLEIAPVLAFELTHNQFGTQDGNLTPSSSTFKRDISSNALSIVPTLPFSDKANVFVELGQHIWEVETTAAGVSSSSDGSDLFYGFGFTYEVREQLRAGFEFSRYNIDSENFKTTSVSLAYLF